MLTRPGECGVMYRPGEMSMPELNHCRLDEGHGGKFHSTRRSPSDQGFEWRIEIDTDGVDWPKENT